MRAAVVGHVEWVDFARVSHAPAAGEIVHATEAWEVAGGGGAVAAVQLARLAGSATLFTALGDDARGSRSQAALEGLGVRVAAVIRDEPQRRAFTHVDAAGERTITVLGRRLEPSASDPLPWEELADADAVYLTAGDAEAVRLARKARVLVATSRVLPLLREAAVELDALVGSANDSSERYEPGSLTPPPRLVVLTDGAAGGTFAPAGEPTRRYAAAPAPARIADTYGAGDSFAAGLAFALAEGRDPAAAVAFAAECGAAVIAGAGPYEAQLRLG